MNFTIAAILALCVQEEPSLKPLCEVAKRLDEGIKAFIAGKGLKESFKNWDSGEATEDEATKLREDFVKNHVVVAKTFAIDLRLHFYVEGKMVYELKALVRASPTEANLLAFKGRASSSSGKPSVLPEKVSKDAKPFGDAGLALLKLLKTKKPDDLPFADGEKSAGLIPTIWRGEMKKALEDSKAGADALRKELNDLKYDEMKIALNEQMFTALDSEGLTREGMIRGKFKFTEEGAVTFRLDRYESK